MAQLVPHKKCIGLVLTTASDYQSRAVLPFQTLTLHLFNSPCSSLLSDSSGYLFTICVHAVIAMWLNAFIRYIERVLNLMNSSEEYLETH